MTEKETVEKILRSRGVIDSNNVFNAVKFRKFVTEPWIHAKTKKYGFDKLGVTEETVNEHCIKEAAPVVTIDAAPIVEEVVEEVAETPAEEPVVEEVKEEIAEEVIAEEPVTEEVVEEVKEEVVEEVAETPAEEPAPKKKSSKKKA